MKCKGCVVEKPVEEFPVRKDRSGRLRPYCRECSASAQKARYNSYRKNNPFLHKVTRAKVRAKAISVPFDLTKEYLQTIWTGVCPVFGTPIYLDCDRVDENAAELDRFVPSKGYVIGNVHFLSRRANRLKNNVTSSEVKKLLEWMERHESNFN